MTKIAVTGGSGKAGRVVVRDLFEHGHEVLNIDQVRLARVQPPGGRRSRFCAPTSPTSARRSRRSAAATRCPGSRPSCTSRRSRRRRTRTAERGVRVNVTSTHAVFSAAQRLGLRADRVGVERDDARAAVRHGRRTTRRSTRRTCYPETSYALSKVVGEELARASFTAGAGSRSSGLRFSNVMVRADYDAVRRVAGRPARAQVEPVGLRRREPRRAERAPRPGGRHRRDRQLHHRRRRHGHAHVPAAS